MKTLFLFVDGLGLTPPGPANPVNPEVCPLLCRLIDEESVPIDACLETKGLPQSATGQAALYTGINAAQHMGRHQEGFPGPTLRSLIESGNLFLELTHKGISCCFADAYFSESIEEVRARRFKSVTTVMALTCPQCMRLTPDMLSNQAVLHDLTRQVIVPKGYAGPIITPEKAAEHLLHIALSHDFTLFEFFLSDLAGHSQNYDQACQVLRNLDAFLGVLVPALREKNLLFILTSDHGNIEDMATRGHTTNPIPLVAFGPSAEELKIGAVRLTDLTPRLLRILSPHG